MPGLAGRGSRDGTWRASSALLSSCGVAPARAATLPLVALTAAPGAGAPSRPPSPKGSLEPGLTRWAITQRVSGGLGPGPELVCHHGGPPRPTPPLPCCRGARAARPSATDPCRRGPLAPRLAGLQWTRRPDTGRKLESGLGSVPSDRQSGTGVLRWQLNNRAV